MLTFGFLGHPFSLPSELAEVRLARVIDRPLASHPFFGLDRAGPRPNSARQSLSRCLASRSFKASKIVEWLTP